MIVSSVFKIRGGIFLINDFVNLLKRLDNYLTHIEKFILIISSFSITFLTALSAINRYYIKLALPWTEELSLLFFMFLVFYGMSNIAKHEGHLRVSLLEFMDRNKKYHFYYSAYINIITIFITIMGVFYGVRMVITTTRTTPYLHISYSIILFFSFVMGFMFYSIRILSIFLIPLFRDRKEGGREDR